MYISLLILLLNSIVSGQTIEKGWRGIEPLKTDKATVNKLLGTPKADNNDYYGYSSDEAFVQINYSTVPCQDNQYERGKFDIPQNTVLDYSVHIKGVVKLAEMKFNRERYIRDTSGDVENTALYINEENGIMISVGIQDGTEYIEKISYRPSKKNAERLKCKS